MTIESKQSLIFEVLDEIAVFNHLETIEQKQKSFQTIKDSLTAFVLPKTPNKSDNYINNSKILIASNKGYAKGKLKAIQINLENALTELI